ncbi:benzoylformate decarboxylase [Cryobacterium sp. Hh7]|uniref:benzoylformate decarboxylase n=1 Tax=Cryobacterium sp. Hh7 TaxID=1259159 RepID=UPI00106C82A1|nr:benzoylformate decarboxylase [Cryobacterium sp. Hh7]TFD59668.1 benzoylformate decarboxylase [Cryobacterium sp. Hh7]
MATVREATYDILRKNGLTTIFGNPGSNELPFLDRMPADFRYILGLHEGVVTGMADGYSLVTGEPAFVNLHSAAGTGNAMGAIANAWYSHSPLVISAGQQARPIIGLESMLSNVDATQLPQPLVKLSLEPSIASDVPRAIAQSIHTATAAPRGPVYVSIPWDDWTEDAGEASEFLSSRVVTTAGSLSPGQLADITELIGASVNPVLILGADVDAAGAGALAVELAERQRTPVWVAPSASRCPFPTRHPCFRGVLPASIAGLSSRLAGHDLILVIGAPVFRYHQFQPGRYLPAGAALIQITSDPGEAARAPMGDAVIADVHSALAALVSSLPIAARAMPIARTVPGLAPVDGVLTLEAAFDVVNAVAPDDAIYVREATTTAEAFWDRIEMRHPGSYFFPAAGGLGFGMPATVGAQLASANRKVIGVIGDGSANYGIPALWTAARYRIPATFLILNNGTYGALRAFATQLGVEGVPGMDLGGVDFCALATGYGVRSSVADSAESLRESLTAALAGDVPTLIEIPIRATPTN